MGRVPLALANIVITKELISAMLSLTLSVHRPLHSNISLNTCKIDLILMNLNKMQDIELNDMFTFVISLCQFQFFSSAKKCLFNK